MLKISSNFYNNDGYIVSSWVNAPSSLKNYKRVIKNGFFKFRGGFFLKRLFNTSYFDLNKCRSKSMGEYFVNDILLEVDRCDLEGIVSEFVFLSKILFLKLKGGFSVDEPVVFSLLISDDYASLKMYVQRTSEPEVLLNDLNSYKNEKILKIIILEE